MPWCCVNDVAADLLKPVLEVLSREVGAIVGHEHLRNPFPGEKLAQRPLREIRTCMCRKEDLRELGAGIFDHQRPVTTEKRAAEIRMHALHRPVRNRPGGPVGMCPRFTLAAAAVLNVGSDVSGNRRPPADVSREGDHLVPSEVSAMEVL